MKDIVYVMNVDWNWIKQRPHFIAEKLNKSYKLHVLYQHRYSRKGYQSRSSGGMDITPMYVIPRGDRNSILIRVNQFIKRKYIYNAIKKNHARFIILTFPDQFGLLPKDYDGCVIYDCMDNHPAFVHDESEKKRIMFYEKQLVERASIVFCSAERLAATLCKRYGERIKDKIHIVRNGYDGKVYKPSESIKSKKSQYFTLTYFGTISEWFDFDNLLKSLNDFSNIRYNLYGPLANITIPNNDRIRYCGTLEHDQLATCAEKSDCLIMPFVVNELIESVDPVKLYEYINFNKNIITCYYNEISRFEPFVHFYSDYDSFKNNIDELLNCNNRIKYSNEERCAFLKNNSWDARCNQIVEILNNQCKHSTRTSK